MAQHDAMRQISLPMPGSSFCAHLAGDTPMHPVRVLVPGHALRRPRGRIQRAGICRPDSEARARGGSVCSKLRRVCVNGYASVFDDTRMWG